ncbi:MAG: hypothetical protein EXS03_04695 [Phycisphaerales bacterium]|nr:hypothetical protein [Phycisphaerales bacterium]
MSVRHTIGVLALLTLASCATGPSAGERVEQVSDEPTNLTPVGDQSTPMMRVSLPVDDGTNTGIALLTWAIDDNTAVIETFFHAHRPTCIPPEVQANLARNGLAVAQTTLDGLPEALNALGGTSMSVSAWLSQATQWHRIAHTNLPELTACVVNGKSQRLLPGSLQLLVRGWTVPLERGAVTDLELVPMHLPGGSVPGARRTASEPFASAALSVSLPRRAVLLVTSMTPRGKSSSSRGPSAGPPVTAPPTLGELLLPSTSDESLASRRRPVLVIGPLMLADHFAEESPLESPPSTP